MSELVQLRKKAQLTLPLSIRKQLGIEEGDFVDVQVVDNKIVLKLKKVVDKEQLWFWTKRWQEGEKEAEDDIKAGRVYEYTSADAAIADLNKAGKKSPVKKRGRH